MLIVEIGPYSIAKPANGLTLELPVSWLLHQYHHNLYSIGLDKGL